MTDTPPPIRPAIRPAEPVDPDRIAALLWETDPHILGALHGGDTALGLRHVARQWAAPEGLFSHRHCTGAWTDETLIGIELGFTAETQAQAVDPHLETAEDSVEPHELEAMSDWWEGYGMLTLPAVPGDAYYLQNLSVEPRMRRRGIGEKLVLNAIAVASEAGQGRVHLDVCEDNPAIRLFERLGFKVVVETRVAPLAAAGFPTHLRMELKF